MTGSRGFIGSSFIEVVLNTINYKIIRPSHQQMDISSITSIERVVLKYRPDTIINFAAHRNANTAEEQRNNKKGSAWKTNVIGAKNLAELCSEYKAHLVHISTDMVFSGYKTRRGPYSEKDTPENDPENLSWYGWTKRLAEKEIGSRKISASIVRIGNVTKPTYNPSLDYIGKVLWLYDNGYSIFRNQYITLTRIGDLIQVILKLVDEKINGIFHVASSDLVTPARLAEHLIRKVGSKKGAVRGSNIDRYLKGIPNRYPKFGGLKSQFTQEKLGIKFMTWKEMVSDFINNAS